MTGLRKKTFVDLRRRAEERLRSRELERKRKASSRRASKLGIYYVELEIQNEELLETRRQLEAGLERYTELFDFAPIGYVIVAPSGVIGALNFAAATLLRGDRHLLVGRRLQAFTNEQNALELSRLLSEVATKPGERTTRTCELSVVAVDETRDVRLSLTSLAGEAPRVLIAMEDVTAGNREKALRVEQRERQRLHEVTRRDLDAVRRLHEIDMLFLPEGSSLDAILDKVVEAAIAISGADMGDLGIFDRRSGAAKIRAHRGLPPSWIEFWDNAAGLGSRGTAARLGERAVIEDTEQSAATDPRVLAIERRAHVRAVVSTPLVSRSGRVLGTLSAFYQNPHRPDDHELQLLDLLSRQAADLIDRAEAEQANSALRRRLEALDRVSTLLSRHLTEHRGAPMPAELLCEIAEIARSVCAADYAAVRFGPPPCVVSGADFADVHARLEAVAKLLEAGTTRSVQHRDGDATFLASSVHEPGRPGCVCLARKSSLGDFDDDDRITLETLADRIGLGLDAIELTHETKEAVRARENLLAVVSHDLRSPLSAIRLSASLMTRLDPSDRAQHARQLDVVLRSADRMTRLIEDLLQAASIEAGRLTVELTCEDVLPMMREAIAALEPITTERSVQLECDIPDDIPQIRADRGRVMQILSNLVGNAVKFTRAGGRVGLRARRQGDHVEFSVSDDGPGIPEEERARIFERYERGRATGRRGVGLGLYIAKGIVDAHQGKMWVESEVGEGATFYFTIPIDGAR